MSGLQEATPSRPAQGAGGALQELLLGAALAAASATTPSLFPRLVLGWINADFASKDAFCGIEKFFQDIGFQNFNFDWLVTPGMSIYTIVIAAVWQSSGFIMAIFLAGLRSIDDEIIKAAKIDGAGIVSIYTKIILPMMRPVFMSAIVILVHLAIKSYDLVIALTAGGPGISSDMPAVFMTQMAFHRSEIGLASASAIMMFLTVTAIVVPYLYSELKREDERR